jgi:hypothetical protein
MTEEIIIDGVNVKNCKRRIGKNSYCRYFKRPCADNNFNCIWKQHERLKEENQKLTETCESLLRIQYTLANSCKKYRSALEEIKHILEIHKDELEECLHNDIDGMIQNKINEVLK